jgi:hypothetical protein
MENLLEQYQRQLSQSGDRTYKVLADADGGSTVVVELDPELDPGEKKNPNGEN